jgi:hypothetical protein
MGHPATLDQATEARRCWTSDHSRGITFVVVGFTFLAFVALIGAGKTRIRA